MELAALDSPLARDIARAMIDGFNRHYTLFRTESARAKHRFETCDWHGQQRAQRERIEFYDLRVRECVRLGYTNLLLPKSARVKAPENAKVVALASVGEAIAYCAAQKPVL